MQWFKIYKKEDIQAIFQDTLMSHLNIVVEEVTNTTLSASMPVDARTVQPMRILHGGASAALIETLGSMASYMIIDPEKFFAVGLQLSVNHLKPVKEREMRIVGKALPVHIGQTTHIWNVNIRKIKKPETNLVATGRLTMLVRPQK